MRRNSSDLEAHVAIERLAAEYERKSVEARGDISTTTYGRKAIKRMRSLLQSPHLSLGRIWSYMDGGTIDSHYLWARSISAILNNRDVLDLELFANPQWGATGIGSACLGELADELAELLAARGAVHHGNKRMHEALEQTDAWYVQGPVKVLVLDRLRSLQHGKVLPGFSDYVIAIARAAISPSLARTLVDKQWVVPWATPNRRNRRHG